MADSRSGAGAAYTEPGHLVPPGGRRLSGSTWSSHKDTIQMEEAAEGQRRPMAASVWTVTAKD